MAANIPTAETTAICEPSVVPPPIAKAILALADHRYLSILTAFTEYSPVFA